MREKRTVKLRNWRGEEVSTTRACVEIGDFDYTLWSYSSAIATYEPATDTLILYENWNYSRTTRKHLSYFLDMFGIPSNTEYLAQKEILA